MLTVSTPRGTITIPDPYATWIIMTPPMVLLILAAIWLA